MNFEPNDDQRAILDGLEQLIDSVVVRAPTTPCFVATAPDLEAALAEAGFTTIEGEGGFGPLEAALVAERLARLPVALASVPTMLIAPALGLSAADQPIALAATASAAARFLPLARTLVVLDGDGATVREVDPADVEPVETLFAYPYARLRDAGAVPRPIADVAGLRRRWRIALAIEAAGAMRAGIDQVVEHVTARHAFGRPLGSFQAIQHRLAAAAAAAEAVRWLALRAAWSQDEGDAAIAAGYAQDRIPDMVYDLQQFSGAMGLTLEFPLHLWTYRLRALLGELDGASGQARAAAAAVWPTAA